MADYFICPVCGEDVKVGALACPGCGACEKTGLKEDYLENEFVHNGLNLPDEEFDYDAFVKKEFEGKAVKSRKEVVIRVIAACLILLFVLIYLL